jgi:hypothetical protein
MGLYISSSAASSASSSSSSPSPSPSTGTTVHDKPWPLYGCSPLVPNPWLSSPVSKARLQTIFIRIPPPENTSAYSSSILNIYLHIYIYIYNLNIMLVWFLFIRLFFKCYVFRRKIWKAKCINAKVIITFEQIWCSILFTIYLGRKSLNILNVY